MIRTIRVEEITKNIKEMCIEANHFLSPDMAEAMKCAEKNEEAPLGKQATEIQIAAEHILRTKKKLNEILAANTGKPLEVIQQDTERDNFMSAEEAKEYGLIDEVIVNH